MIAPPSALSAHAAMTPSGVPPMPKRMLAPLSGQAVEIAPATSPSGMRRMRAPGLAALLDDLLVTGAVEDHGRDVVDVLAERLRHRAKVVGDRHVEVDDVGGLGADRDLLHVDAGSGIEHRAPLGDRDHRDGVGSAERGERGAVDRVDGDVARRTAVADLLAVVEHRRFVLLALADDDDAVHRDAVEHEPHGIDRGAVGGVLVAPAHPAPGRRAPRPR